MTHMTQIPFLYPRNQRLASSRLCVNACSGSFLQNDLPLCPPNLALSLGGLISRPRKRDEHATLRMIMKTKIKLFPARLFCAMALGIGSSFHLVPQYGMQASAHNAPAR